MIYLLYGNDEDKARGKLHTLAESLRAKKPDASFIGLNEETFSVPQLPELIGSQGLFERKLIVVLDHLVKNKVVGDEIVKSLKEFGESESIFIFLEGTLDKKTLSKFEKYGEKAQEFSSTVVKAKPDFSIWSLGDALGRRDKVALWSKYREALGRGISVEEIHGVLFWQVKSMLITASSISVRDSGLNPFVFKKSEGFLKNYKESELSSLSNSLIAVSHDARRGRHTFEIALESLTLGI
ncbi:MAG: hypothetical protein ISR99_03055 [Parcubacteria group bacterium]|nr:hypothetical protein [Parcubacteria group bacterium]